MWAAGSTATSRLVRAAAGPLSRSYASSKSVVLRSFMTGTGLTKSCMNGGCDNDSGKPQCKSICVKEEDVCSPKPKPCHRKPCLPPCHACPAEDPCWHCPYTPPPCPKRKPCCPICPSDNPYLYKENCCPIVDCCPKKCAPCETDPPPRRLTRCERPGAHKDPCCPRFPKCPSLCIKPGDKPPDECENDCPEKPIAPDPCQVEGEICSEEGCEFKKPETCCPQKKDPECCPRKEKEKKKKRVIKESCCLNLDPDWPPKRPHCDCNFPVKEDGPCQQTACSKKEFWDGLC